MLEIGSSIKARLERSANTHSRLLQLYSIMLSPLNETPTEALPSDRSLRRERSLLSPSLVERDRRGSGQHDIFSL